MQIMKALGQFVRLSLGQEYLPPKQALTQYFKTVMPLNLCEAVLCHSEPCKDEDGFVSKFKNALVHIYSYNEL